MKNSKKFFICLLAISCIPISTVFSQNFALASGNDIPFSASTTPRATGNDVLEYSSTIYQVSVWDVNGRFGWVVGANASTVQLQNTPAGDPDVCLVIDGDGIVHALIVYFDETNKDYLLEVYDWGGSSFSSQGSPIVLDNGTSVPQDYAINIDSEPSGNFIIIFNEDDSEELLIVTGNHSGGTVSLNNGGAPVSYGITCYTPDVCLYGDRVTYTYIDSGGDLIVDSDDFSDIASGISSSNNNLHGVSPTSGFSFAVPRIACPRNGAGTSNDWTVVAEENDGTNNYFIIGYNNNNTSLSIKLIYNDQSQDPYHDISFEQNMRPVVAYNSQDTPTIMIGWTIDNNSNNLGATWTSYYPIVVRCDDYAAVVSGQLYLDVNKTLGNGYLSDFLSLSGRHAFDRLYLTYFESDLSSSNDVYHKVVTTISSANNLKLSYPGSFDELPEYEKIIVNLYDNSGRLFQNSIVRKSEITSFLDGLRSEDFNFIFIVEVISIDGQFISRKKLMN